MQAKVLKKTIVIGIALGVLAAVTVLSLMPPSKLPDTGGWFTDIPFGDKIVHFCFYFCVVTAVRFAKTYTTGYTKACPVRLLVLAALYGGAIELLQGAYFDRGCDIWDEAANVLGAFAAIRVIPQRWHERLSAKFGGRSADQP